ncbi:Rieske 2Fe-2S domain-containing protein [Cupriavidus basilensis]
MVRRRQGRRDQDELLARRLLDEPIVFFRKSNGEVGALADRCPHRFVPLHLGRGDRRYDQCGYHGLQFDVPASA